MRPKKRKKMPRSDFTGSRERLKEIVGVLRDRHVMKGLTPVKLRLIFEDLGPTFIKFGQIISMRPDILPLPYCEELSRLRADVRPMSFEEACAELEKEFGKPADELFSRLDRRPIGAASISQVHYAELKNGEKVVVKIRRPGIRRTMKRDVVLLHRVSGLLKVVSGTGNAIDFNKVIDEMWAAAQQEMDFLNEAKQAEEFRRLNRNVAYVRIPRVLSEYSTSAVLVMEYLDGIEIDNTAALTAEGYDLNEIGGKLSESYVKQITEDGFFHADPHPGNLRILSGKIVWLDMGMMGRLTQRDRSIFRSMMSAVSRGDVNEICNLLLVFCDPPVLPDRSRLYSDIDGLLNRYETLDVGNMNILRIRNDILALTNRNGLSVPPGVTMLGRGLITLEGVISKISPEINLMQILANHLSGRLLEGFNPDQEAKKFLLEFLQSGKKIPYIPSQISELLNMQIKGQTKMNIEITGSERPLHMIGRVANRVALGLMEASLLIASSILCISDLPKTFFGIPALGAAGFVLSLALGIWILWDIHRDR